MNYDSIAKASKTLMFKEPFYGLFLITLNKEIDIKKTMTACVSKNNINCQLTINPEFWEKLTDDCRAGVLQHELLHIGFFHLLNHDRFPDKLLFNLAADLEVNQYVGDKWKDKCWEDLQGVELHRYPELNLPPKAGTRKYYEILDTINKQRQQNQQQCQQACQKPGQGPSGNQNQPGQGQGQSQSQQGSGSGNDGSSPDKSKIWDIYDGMKQGEPQVCSHELWKEFYENASEADKKLIRKQIDHQLKEIANTIKDRGTIPSEMKEYIDNLFNVEDAVINWKAYLRRFSGYSNKVYTKKSRRKLNKRFSSNPALKIKTKKTLLVARDTSGSTSKEDHDEFFNELHHIWKTGIKIFIADADADVADVFEYKGTPPDHMSGRGGTDFDPAIIYYNENKKLYNALVYMTDGYCPAPSVKPHNNMLWVISSNGSMNDSVNYPGQVVQIVR